MLTDDDRRSTMLFSWTPPPARSIDVIRRSAVASRLQENLDMIRVGARNRPSQAVDILCAHSLVDTAILRIYWTGGLTCDDGRPHSMLQRVLANLWTWAECTNVRSLTRRLADEKERGRSSWLVDA